MSSETAVSQTKNTHSAGSRLQRAREDKGWSVPETAEKLHVIPRYVRAIENGDYGDLPGLVFLKGYVRSYARLVNLSEDRLIEDLEQELLVAGNPLMEPAEAATSPAGFEETRAAGSRWLVAVVVIILAAGGYFLVNALGLLDAQRAPAVEEPLADSTSEGQSDTTGVQPSSVREVLAPVAQEPGKEERALEAPVERPLAEPAVDEPALEAPVVTEPAAPESGEPEPAELAVVEAPAPVAPEVTETEPETVMSSDENGVDTAAAEPTEIAGAGGVTVRAVFTGDCWFDLRDRDNNRTVGLYRAGDVVDFSGHYPLRFIVGAVDAVSIQVGGEPLDFSQYRVRNNRVELVLEQ